MFISFINNVSGNGKSSLCLGLANSLYAAQREVEIPVTIFDCDPGTPLYDKFEKQTGIYPATETQYQILPLSLDDDRLVETLLKEASTQNKYYLIDLPGEIEDWKKMRIIMASDIVVIPFTLTEIEKESPVPTLLFVLNVARHAKPVNLETKIRRVIVPVDRFPDKDLFLDLEKLKKILEHGMSNTYLCQVIGKMDNLLENTRPKVNDLSDCVEFRPLYDLIKKIIKDIAQPKINKDDEK